MKSLAQIHRDELRVQVIDANPSAPAEGDSWYDKTEDVFKLVSGGGVIVYRRVAKPTLEGEPNEDR